MEDEQLIEHFLSGEVEAFNTLVRRYEKPVYNFALRYLGDSETAQDVMQNTFIKAYKGISKLRDRMKFSTWVFRIALNQCRDEWKRKRKLNSLKIDFKEKDRSSLYSSSSDFQSDNASSILRIALQKLPDKQRVIVILKVYHELKFCEISEILDVPLNTVKSRMYYALNSIRRVLKQLGINREDFNYEL